MSRWSLTQEKGEQRREDIPAPAGPHERTEKEKKSEKRETKRERPDNKKNFPTIFSEAHATKISKNMGKCSANQNQTNTPTEHQSSLPKMDRKMPRTKGSQKLVSWGKP